ncbi:hypothetical protein [Bacillus toyonensis]|uniref:hypothetical protein n=1 Tax=Bacillus toyonensis TaxID=155322 RepID=UPI000BF33403|nr:hypothetical protein [Bacillus toyonensis]PGF05274.1 hypothetical protein COM61_02360 [Bacillus toyonensis]
MSKGFTLICNECENKVDYKELENKRHNTEKQMSVTIHSLTECGFICFSCENKVRLNDKEKQE